MFLLVVFLLLTFSFIFADDTSETLSSISQLHSSEGINNLLAKPLFGGTEFKTLNGKQTFNAPLECPSEENAVVIAFIPEANREWRVIIKGDLDLNGQYEHYFDTSYLGVKVSGVCTNGIVYCSPYYSWNLNHCKYYKWTISNNWITLEPTPTAPGACICTNSACNGSNIPPYKYIAGAVSNLLMQTYPNLLLSKGKWDLNTFTYSLYGQDKTKCSGLSGQITDFSGHSLTSYEETHIYPSVDLTEVQSNNPQAYEALISASQVQINGYNVGTPSIYTCTIKKDVSISTKTEYENCVNKYSFNGKTWCIVDVDKHGGCHVCAIISSNLTLYPEQELILLIPGHIDNCDDDGNILSVSVSGDINFSIYKNCGSWNFRQTNYLQLALPDKSKRYLYVYAKRCHTGHCGSSTEDLYLLKSLKYLQDYFSLTEQNNCNPDEDCKIKNEWICPPNVVLPTVPSLGFLRQYCIQTIYEGTPVHPTLQPMCKTVSTQVDTYTICMDGNKVEVKNSNGEIVYSSTGDYMWFQIYREYNCGVKKLNIDLTKVNQTRESASYSNGNISYTDYVGGTGSNAITINIGSSSQCSIPSCVVKIIKTEADVFSDATQRNEYTGSSRYDYEVLECKQNSLGAWYCPVPSGGVILQPCSCTQSFTGFNIAIPVLQAVDEASHDIICSQE